MTVARSVDELARQPRAVAIGTFDGVHLGHRRILAATVADGRTPTAVTFDPHPRAVLTGNQVELITSLDRRIELLDACGIEDVLVVEFTQALAGMEAEQFVHEYLEPIGVEVVLAGPSFRFGRGASGDLELLRRLGLDARLVPFVEGVSSTQIRQLLRAGDVPAAARLLGRPAEIEGTVVSGDARGGTLGFPTANLAVPANVLVPQYGIYAGAAGQHRAAISIGVNPHYGGRERRIEAFLLDFSGDRRRALGPAPGGARVRQRAGADRADRTRRRGDAGRRASAGRRIRPVERRKFRHETASSGVVPDLLRCGAPTGEPGDDSRDSPLPGLRRALFEAARRRHRPRQSGLPRVRIRRLGPRARVAYGSRRAEPLRRGSPAPPVRVIALTPPK